MLTILISYLTIGSLFCALFYFVGYHEFKKESDIKKREETSFIIMMSSLTILLWPIILLMFIVDIIKGTPRDK